MIWDIYFCHKWLVVYALIFSYMYSGYILREVSSAQASTSSVLCCHFSSDGKLIATGGHDKKVKRCVVVLAKLFSGLDSHVTCSKSPLVL